VKAAPQPQHPVEFDHAISYVTTIKQRFANEPKTYKSFLEILHTYQKEQRGIKEVLEQVSHLFADHPDLLEKFTYFLPDAVQDQAKESLQRAAAESEARLKHEREIRALREQREQRERQQKLAKEEALAARRQPISQLPFLQQPQQQPLQVGRQVVRETIDQKQRKQQQQQQQQQQQLQQQQKQQKQQQQQPHHSAQANETVLGLPGVSPAQSAKKLPFPATPVAKEPCVTKISNVVEPPVQQGVAKKLLGKVQGKMILPILSQPVPRIIPSKNEQPPQPPPQKTSDVIKIDVEPKISPTVVKQPKRKIEVPETFVYNSGVERQFFDSVKERLTSSRDGNSWTEFLKCLDMYSQEVFSRHDMLEMVKTLFGKNIDLFDEFKKILAAAGSQETMHDDTWYSVPILEIDFARCRQCTPSYRALPRDYPNPPCSERSPVEAAVLNNTYVSLPVGSEESYNYRHMRRNQYEETLFRCEDKAFEIDMVIDSNVTTIRKLELVEREILLLSQDETLTPGLCPDGSPNLNTIISSGAGGKCFQYKLDCQFLGTIHINSITRIYGENGQEMIKLIFKNPTKTIPVVLKRLKQKDTEWRTARQILVKRWKEQNEINYYKSLDHRSFYWRQQDKKNTSTRALILEIKDRAANGGREGKASVHAKKEKAKEEHGAFYEITNGRKLRGRSLNLSAISAPTKTLFTPHVSVGYENVSWAIKDAYKLLVFATEKSTLSNIDKERMHRLWRDFLNPFFGLNNQSMRTSVIGEDETNDPIPPGVFVSTPYGNGTIIDYRCRDGLYLVSFSWGGRGFLSPSAVLCSIVPVEESSLTSQYRKNDNETLSDRSQLMFGTQSFYLFIRLHHLLVQRLWKAKQIADSWEGEVQVSRPDFALGSNNEIQNDLRCGKARYDAYLSILHGLVDGHNAAGENTRYEEKVRSLMGNNAYELYTMDKLINHTLKHLQAISSDEAFGQLVQVYRRHKKTGLFKPTAFKHEVAALSFDDIYAFQFSKVKGSRKKHGFDAIMHIEYLEMLTENDENPIGLDVAMVDADYDIGFQNLNKRQRR